MSEVQRLAFKPTVDMTPFKTQMLDATRGSAINPVVEYLQKGTKCSCHNLFHHHRLFLHWYLHAVLSAASTGTCATTAVPTEALALIRDASTVKKLPTVLYRSTHKPIFHTWTALLLPKITAAPSPAYRPAGSSVLLRCDDTLHKKKTVRSIKETSKFYTVSPMDFCGHTRAVPRGKGWVISLCRWDPTLSDTDQHFIMDSWNALGDVDMEVKRRKALHQEAAYQKALQKAAEAAVGNAKKRSRKAKAKFNACAVDVV
ncbi:hypothetical protein K438DRAFT_1786633 [Mycena galopus ATCC 62051]|nr:hypothetical protein K438DRAFT_1786633 [Mycena galopus ATCC 62051]